MDRARRAHRAARGCRAEGPPVLTTLFCSAAALEAYGDDWRAIAPALDFLVLPDDRHLEEHEMATIDLAVFSADLWREQRGPSFMKVLLQAPNVQWLHMFSAGLDNPVFAMLGERGITVTHSAGSSAVPIAHTVVMHLIAMCRDARPLSIAQSNHEWSNRGTLDVEGRRLGIVGLGAIGSEVARLAAHFGMHVIGVRRAPTGDEPCEAWSVDRLHELLPRIDDLVLTAPLTDDTRGIIGDRELDLLPVGAHVVNVGRGELVDEPALVRALLDGRVGAAALDVFAIEPLPADSPLWDMPNVIVTPHSAGTTPLAAQRAAEIFLDNLGRFLRAERLRNIGFGG
ncbi:MAG: D-2-hydroxyacid dehydrogenase [Actinobacteria bacterium]|nr:D-2-hydroxyacid dehydrogenase [Actinomycetota bacterium]